MRVKRGAVTGGSVIMEGRANDPAWCRPAACPMAEESAHARRSAATRRKLLDAAAALFEERGYAEIGTEEIVRAAGVTRGAMYHQFADKAALLAALVEEMEAELMERVAERALAAEQNAVAQLHAGAMAFLDEVAVGAFRQIVLVDAPSVLGHERWREISLRYGLGLVEALVTHGMESGQLTAAPPRALAHLLIGAIDEAVLVIAAAENPVATRADVDAALKVLVDAFAA